MLPPPPAIYENAIELFQSAQTFANSQGYDHSSIPPVKTNIHELQPLLQTLQEKYEEWPEHQQVAVREKLNNMINTPLTTLQNPQVVRTRGRPPGALNRRTNNSTRRDPSGFELVDRRVRRCTHCKQPGHYASTCPNRN
ncbi:12601_t:CDS:2 [Cetraspora pellucida]|uniref:12601_t:CDS:1 n=1 Tax=Cetraspora pellucida TaxID=1433469 RepID=A0ACA9L029_9GLOM|nr:12601_t:CDS:2 [Cetraspora pellucida]